MALYGVGTGKGGTLRRGTFGRIRLHTESGVYTAPGEVGNPLTLYVEIDTSLIYIFVSVFISVYLLHVACRIFSDFI